MFLVPAQHSEKVRLLVSQNEIMSSLVRQNKKGRPLDAPTTKITPLSE